MSVFKRWNGTSWETIGPQISSARFDDTNHMIAPEYSSTSTYNVGDYVVQSDKLYKCISAIESAEEWIAAHWTQISMSGEVSDLKSAISDLNEFFEHGKNYFNKEDVTIGYYINSDNGNMTQAPDNICASDFIKVKPNTYYYLLTAFGSAGYDVNKQYCQKFTPSSGKLLMSANTEYIRFGVQTMDLNQQYLIEGETPVLYPPYEEHLKEEALPPIPVSQILDPQNLVVSYDNVENNPIEVDVINLFNTETIIEGKYVNPENGTLANNVEFFASDYIYIGDLNTINLSYTFISAWYDLNYTFISAIRTATINADKTFTVPENAKYIRISAWLTDLSRAQVGPSVTRTNYVPYGKITITNLLVDSTQIIRSKTSNNIDGYEVLFLIPNTVYLRPGEDFSIYWNGAILNYFALGNKYYVAANKVDGSVFSPIGKMYNYKWHYTPTAGETFTVSFRVVEKVSGFVVTEKNVNFITSTAKTSKSMNAVFIGDSFIDGYNIVPYTVQMIADGGNELNSLGVNRTDFTGVKDCGWAGETYQWVTRARAGYLRSDRPLSDAIWDDGWGENEPNGWTTGQTYSDLTDTQRSHGHTKNEFWNPSTNKFDFSYFMSTYFPNETCKLFISEYGLNDIGFDSTDYCERTLPTVKTCIDTIIASVKNYNTNIKIGLYLICPNAPDNNVIGEMNNSFPNYQTVLINTSLFNKMLLDNYSDDPNIILIPSNCNFDNRHGIRSGEYKPVKFDDTIIETGSIDIHPSVIGAKYIADSFANLVYNEL